MVRKLFFLAFTVLFLLGTAAALDAEIEALDSKAGEKPAEFGVTVYNTGVQDERFRLSIGSQKSTWFTHENAKTVEAGGNETFTVKVHSPRNALQGNYGFRVHINSIETDKVTTVQDIFTVETPYNLYIQSLEIEDKKVKPGDELGLRFEVQNLATSEVKDYSIEVSSPHFNESVKTFPLDPGGSEFFSFEKVIGNPHHGDYQGNVTIFEDGGEGSSRMFSYTVLKNRSLKETREIDDLIIYRDIELKAENLGNVNISKNFTARIPSYLEPFTFFEEKPDYISEGEGFKTYKWEREIAKGSSDSVKYTVNVWIPVAITALAVIILLSLNSLRTGIKISKRVEETKGGLKIRIEIKNVSRRNFDELKLKDYVPDIASVNEEFEFARPVIRKTSDGTKLTWNVEEFERGDQRIFEYVIKPKVSVDEKVVLQAAKLVDGDETVSSSGETEAEF